MATKLELQQLLLASQHDVAALRHELSIARAEVERLKRSAQREEQSDWPTVAKHVRQIPAHFAAAREAAMRLGKAVKVSV